MSLCGIDCAACSMKADCKGCEATGGSPFGGKCTLAEACKNGSAEAFRQSLIDAFNALHIEAMPPVTELYPLRGAFVNLTCTLPGGAQVKFWDDNAVLMGNQLCKTDADRCYGLAADDRWLLVCEYGENGSDPEIIVFKRWNKP